eukprot:COSAG01_NODE_5030_length_4536_cov_15.098715_4_plen_62_part_01
MHVNYKIQIFVHLYRPHTHLAGAVHCECAWIKSQYTMLRTGKQPHNPSLGDEKLSLAEWIGK